MQQLLLILLINLCRSFSQLLLISLNTFYILVGKDSSAEVTKTIGKVADRSDRIHSRDPFQASDYEVSFQWHHAELSMGSQTTLLYAMNSKAASITDKPATFASIVGVDSLRITLPADLHHSLTELFHAAESELNQTPGELVSTCSVSKWQWTGAEESCEK